MELGGIHHLAIKATDVEKVAAFYRDVLGLAETTRHEDALGLRSIWLSARGAILMIERSSEGTRAIGSDPPGLHLLAFSMRAGEREAWRAALLSRGLTIAGETAYTLYLVDPEGNRVGLSSYPESSR